MNTGVEEVFEKIDERIEKNREFQESHVFSINGRDYIVDPLVFSPGLYKSEVMKFWISTLVKKCKSFETLPSIFEIGTGCGVILLEVALQCGLEKIGASDITKESQINARKNFDKFGFKGEIWTSDVFDSIDDTTKYDLIFWHYPFYQTDKKYEELDPIERALKDNNLRGIGKAFKDLRRFLKAETGRFYMTFSKKMGNYSLLSQLLSENNLVDVEVATMEEQRALCILEINSK